jgi:hypothetical protein
MVDSKKPCWFKHISDDVLAKAGGSRYATDPNAADEFAGDNKNRLDVHAPTGTHDIYGLIEGQIKVRK